MDFSSFIQQIYIIREFFHWFCVFFLLLLHLTFDHFRFLGKAYNNRQKTEQKKEEKKRERLKFKLKNGVEFDL